MPDSEALKAPDTLSAAHMWTVLVPITGSGSRGYIGEPAIFLLRACVGAYSVASSAEYFARSSFS